MQVDASMKHGGQSSFMPSQMPLGKLVYLYDTPCISPRTPSSIADRQQLKWSCTWDWILCSATHELEYFASASASASATATVTIASIPSIRDKF